jgi:hypothetical protein
MLTSQSANFRTLAELPDELLPKLPSGELRVPAQNKEVAA